MTRAIMLMRIAALLVATAIPAYAQTSPTRIVIDSARTEIDHAVERGDIDRLSGALALLERAATASPDDPWVHHYMGYAWYRKAILSQQMLDADPKPDLERARTTLERSIRLRPIAESHAVLSSVLGQMIGSNPIKGMTLGPKSDAEMEKAVALGPQNPRVWMLRGVGALYTPAMFGGGMDKAESHLTKAIDLFARDGAAAPAPQWGRAEAHAWMGQVQAKRKNIAAARASYQRALELEPENGWVKLVLLPALDKVAK
jgi:tetratricopeptide (TPR) repeat protein